MHRHYHTLFLSFYVMTVIKGASGIELLVGLKKKFKEGRLKNLAK